MTKAEKLLKMTEAEAIEGRYYKKKGDDQLVMCYTVTGSTVQLVYILGGKPGKRFSVPKTEFKRDWEENSKMTEDTQWRVLINGKDSGIVETDYEWASKYWANQSRQTGKKYRLVKASMLGNNDGDFNIKRWDRLHGR